MIFSYIVKLLCLCFACFFALNAILSVIVFMISALAIRLAEQMKPRHATLFLFALRVAPFEISLLAVLGLCVPSYLWLEPKQIVEQVGFICICTALIGIAAWGVSISRAVRTVVRSSRYAKKISTSACGADIAQFARVIVVEAEAPFIALLGTIHPNLIISSAAMRTLSAEQLRVAVRHEHGHQTMAHNLQRLILLLSPDVLPCMPIFRTLERSWERFAELAADDFATEGNSGRALTLATSLVRLARIGVSGDPFPLCAWLISHDQDLVERVDRLLLTEHNRKSPMFSAVCWGSASLMATGFVTTALLGTATSLSAIHAVLERLIR